MGTIAGGRALAICPDARAADTGEAVPLASEQHVLMLTTHHIVSDGISQRNAQDELWATYEALVRGTGPDLAELQIQYADYTQWQAECAQTGAYAQDLTFWQKELQAPLTVLDMPTDHPLRNRPAVSAGFETLLLPEDLNKALKQISQRHGATMFMTTLSCFAALLCRHAGRRKLSSDRCLQTASQRRSRYSGCSRIRSCCG